MFNSTIIVVPNYFPITMKGFNCFTKEEYITGALVLETELYDSSSNIADKNEILEKLRLYMASTWKSDQVLNEECFQTLKSTTQYALDKFNEFQMKTPKLSTRGYWVGERGKSKFIVLKRSPYYNKLKELGMTECCYDSFYLEPNFDKVTYPNSIVDITDLYEKYSISELNKRGGSKKSFQEVAQMRMAQLLDPILRIWWKENSKAEYCQYDAFWCWRNEHNLLPHEDANCRTMRLVNRDVHKVFKHAGGIAHASIIKQYIL